MRRALRSSLTYSNVVPTICLFLLLGGVAYATAKPAPGSVGTKQLKNGAVTLKKINKKAQAELRGATGQKGDKGDPGKDGAKGDAGSAGIGVGALFGSGSDGDATLSGTGNSLSRDTYYDDLTLDPGAVLNTNGYRLFVAGRLTMGNGSNINRDGLEISCGGTGFGGNGLAPHTLGGSGAGGCNFAGEDSENSLGGDGGDGTGSENEGEAIPPAADVGGLQVFGSATQALTGRALDGILVEGGAGASGPSPSAPNGGGGGGVVVVAARSVTVSGSASITAVGGEGLGGGGGGVVVVVSSVPKPTGMTLSAAGGEAGSGPELEGQPGLAEWLD
jgi:hypothetical protein